MNIFLISGEKNYSESQSDFYKLSESKNPFEIWEYFKIKSIAFRKL
ncbi:hypothetical protein [Aquimarina addita]